MNPFARRYILAIFAAVYAHLGDYIIFRAAKEQRHGHLLVGCLIYALVAWPFYEMAKIGSYASSIVLWGFFNAICSVITTAVADGNVSTRNWIAVLLSACALLVSSYE